MHFGRKKTLMDRAQDYVEQVADNVLPQLHAALDDAVEKAGPRLTEARERAVPLLEQGRAVAAEKASVGAEKASVAAALAAAKAQEGASMAAERAAVGRQLAAAKMAELRHEPEPEPSKLKKLLLLSGLLALGGVVFAKLRSRSDSSNWQSSYVPSPAPSKGTPSTASTTSDSPGPVDTPTSEMAATPRQGDPLAGAAQASTTGDAETTDDPGGSDPIESMADSTDQPHRATTPDDPATVIDVGDVPGQPRP